MTTILSQLADHARRRVALEKAQRPLAALKAQLAELPTSHHFPFEGALKKDDIAFICECKKASPSKGIIAPDFPYLEIAQAYESAGADAISVLTEPKWFLEKDAYLKDISAQVPLPCLRKDFIVDAYMIYQAKLLGAAAVLLIVSLLNQDALKSYLALCDDLGLSALVEVHDGEELQRACEAGARIIGVNNRILKDFQVDFNNSLRLRHLVPKDTLFVAESGIRTPEDIQKLRAAGVDAVLIGEALMQAPDKSATLQALRGRP